MHQHTNTRAGRPHRSSRLTTLAGLTALLLAACGSTTPTRGTHPSTEPFSVSGTIKAPPGGTVARTVVLACGVKDGDCDQNNIKVTHVQSSGAEAAYTLNDLRPGGYFVIAWTDRNDSLDIDAGDHVGLYSTDGGDTAATVTGATSGANITLGRVDTPSGMTVSGTLQAPHGTGPTIVFTCVPGSDGACVDDKFTAASVAPSGMTVSGTLQAPHGTGPTIVFTCVPGSDGACVDDKFTAASVAADGTFTLSDAPSEPFYLMAWTDANGDGRPGEGDLYGAHRDSGGAVAQLQAPRADVTVTAASYPSTAPTGPAPSQLTGTWVSGTSTGVDYYNSTTGQWAPPSGTGALLEVHADGTFKRGVTVQLSNYGCTTSIIGHYTGRLRVDGSALTLDPTSSRQKYTSSCNSSLNYDRTVPNASLPFTWEIDGYGRLVLTWPTGGKTYYTRQ